jgi:thiamine biosynthesis lipoprotein
VTIVHLNAALADAAATALFVAGKSEWTTVAKGMGIDQVMLVDQQSQVILTPQMQQRIKSKGVSKEKISIVALE